MYLFSKAWAHPATYSVVPCVYSPGLKWAGREADIPYFVPALRMCGAVTALHHMRSCRAQEQP